MISAIKSLSICVTARSTFATRMQAEMPPSGEESDFDWVYRITVSSSTQKPEDLFAPATLCGRNNPFNEQAYKKGKGRLSRRIHVAL